MFLFRTRNELIGKLMEYEKEKFEAATSAQYSELLSDRTFATFLESLKDETSRPPRYISLQIVLIFQNSSVIVAIPFIFSPLLIKFPQF